jgi:hypothetical protein
VRVSELANRNEERPIGVLGKMEKSLTAYRNGGQPFVTLLVVSSNMNTLRFPSMTA